MNAENKTFEFSEPVMYYCKNIEIVKKMEQLWKTDVENLIKYVKKNIADLLSSELEIKYGTKGVYLKKKGWRVVEFYIGFSPDRVGKNKIETYITIRDTELKREFCKKYIDEIRNIFDPNFEPKNWNISMPYREVDGNYADAIVETIRKCIEFIPHLEPYASKATK